MHILINTSGQLILEDIDNMKGFSIIDKTEKSDLSQLLAISIPDEENHYWIDANAVVSMSAKAQDPNWVADFWNMLTMVEKYGYSDMKNKRVKAHIERSV